MATGETAEEISKKPEVRQALSQTSGPKAGTEKVKAATKDKFWFVTHALSIVGCAVLYYLVGSKLIPVPQNTVDLARRFLRGAALIVIVLAVAKAISIYAIGRLDDAATRFTLRRIEHLLVVLIIAVIVIGVIFVNWYTALISVGIGSVIVGLAVQTPMTSFLGWIYILVRRPYQVGDRIQIEDATGDVIDVSYFDTTLGIRRQISFHRPSEWPDHQVSQFESPKCDGVQLLVAAFSLHLERDQILHRLQ